MVEKKKDNVKSWEEIERELTVLNEKCFKDDPEEEDLESLREFLNQYPEAYSMAFELSRIVELKIIREVSPKPGYAIYIEANTGQLRKEMGYENSSTLEKVLIDNVINCWLRLQLVELSPPQPRNFRHDVREDRLTSAQNRFR